MNDRLLTAWRTIAHNTDGPPVLQIPRVNFAELVDELARLHVELDVWKNGVADAVESLGYDRQAACGPADLLPGLADLTDELRALRGSRHNAFTALDKREAEIARLSDAISRHEVVRCNWHRIGMVEGDYGWSCPMCPNPFQEARRAG